MITRKTRLLFLLIILVLFLFSGGLVIALTVVDKRISSLPLITTPYPQAVDQTIKVNQAERIQQRREQIEKLYPELKNFENQESFAGKSVKSIEEGNDFYFAYEVLGSGLPIAQATCFKVDQDMRVYTIGEFPLKTDSYAGYRAVDPKTCRGIK